MTIIYEQVDKDFIRDTIEIPSHMKHTIRVGGRND